MSIDEKMFCAAAKWWADFLREDFKYEMGDDRINSEAKVRRAIAPKFTPEQVDLFEKSLESKIKSHYMEDYERYLSSKEEFPLQRDWYNIDIDYDIRPMFHEAAEEAGIKLGPFDLPGKSDIWISFNEAKVQARPGYHQPEVIIYPKKTEVA